MRILVFKKSFFAQAASVAYKRAVRHALSPNVMLNLEIKVETIQAGSKSVSGPPLRNIQTIEKGAATHQFLRSNFTL
jgi:hypothetical protein